jgi:hypothetical protein
MKFSKRGKTRIKMPATNDTRGESAINIRRQLGRFFVRKTDGTDEGNIRGQDIPSEQWKTRVRTLAYANSAKYSFKGVVAYASIPPTKY